MKLSKRNVFGYMTALLILVAGSARAQQVEISSSLNPVGSGARATGMGGAFISVADDATAASWNPAGLVQLEKPEISLVYSYQYISQKYNSSLHQELSGNVNSWDIHAVNYASAAYPFKAFDRNMIVSLNYQRLYEMNKTLAFSYNWTPKGPVGPLNSKVDTISYRQSGALAAISPAFAVQITPELYCGVTVNIWDGSGWTSNYTSTGQGDLAGGLFTSAYISNDTYKFSGSNANLGVLYALGGKVTVGAVYKFAFDADLKKTGTSADSNSLLGTSPAVTDEKSTMKMPSSFGIGISYKPTDNWVLALDTYYTDWSRFLIRQASGYETNPIYGTPLVAGRLSDTVQMRAGGEYLIILDKSVIPLRAGLFYDPEPARHAVKDFYGFSLGSGISMPRFSFDISYQFRTSSRATGDIPTADINADITQHTVMSSLIYYF